MFPTMGSFQGPGGVFGVEVGFFKSLKFFSNTITKRENERMAMRSMISRAMEMKETSNKGLKSWYCFWLTIAVKLTFYRLIFVEYRTVGKRF